MCYAQIHWELVFDQSLQLSKQLFDNMLVDVIYVLFFYIGHKSVGTKVLVWSLKKSLIGKMNLPWNPPTTPPPSLFFFLLIHLSFLTLSGSFPVGQINKAECMNIYWSKHTHTYIRFLENIYHLHSLSWGLYWLH